MKKLERDPNTKIYIPVFIDATCSGIQHLSSMVAVAKLAALVNITKDLIEKREDFYQSLVDPINNAINKLGKTKSEFEPLSNLFLDRKYLKRPIMTQNYNVSIFGMKQQLYDSLKVEETIDDKYVDQNNIKKDKEKRIKIIGHNKEGHEILLNSLLLMEIAIKIKEIIFVKFPVLKEIYDYFINIATLMENLNLPVQWLTPTGAIIIQDYKKTKKKRLEYNYIKRLKLM